MTESATSPAASTNQISWNVYGKISKVLLGTGGSLEYGYDVSGNRVYKIYTKPDASTETTYYVRDATGNTLATYQQSGGTTTWAEQHLYGSSRLGYWKPGMNVTSGDANTLWTAADNKRYELTNHLGNVLAVISDARNGSMQAGVISMQDYYPFGSAMPGRYGQLDGNGVIGEDVSGSGYRFGFNGKENDNEVKGEGNQQDYGLRIYDQRLGRFLSVDPLTQEYPWYTPYQFAGNKPIKFIDLDGAEEYDPASKPTGIAHITMAKVPGGDETKSVWLGNYEMRGFRAGNGSAYWIARYHHTEGKRAGMYQDEFVVGADAFAKFSGDKEGHHYRSNWAFSAGTNNKVGLGILGDVFKEGWKPQNVINGALILAGGLVANVARYSVDPNKMNYFFGRIVTGAKHNVERSAQNMKDLATLGIKTEGQLLKVFDEAIESGVTVGTNTNKYGVPVTRSVEVGGKGRVDVSFFYEGGNMGATPKVTTLIPKIYKDKK